MKQMTFSIFVFLIGAFHMPNADAANYFSWGVESDIYPYFRGTTRDCAVSHSGQCSMRLNVIGNDNGNQQMGADLLNPFAYPFTFVGAPALYYRWWMRIEPGFSWGNDSSGAGAKTKASRTIGGPIFNGSGAQGYTSFLASTGFQIGECGSAGCRLANGAINTDDNLYIPYDFRSANDGRWHEYIVKIKPNTSGSCMPTVNCDAQFEAWVDGRLVGRNINFKLHSDPTHTLVEAWGGWMVTPYFQLRGTSSDGGTIYLDDYSTDSQYNSLLGNRPNPPVNLSIVPQ